MRLQENALMKAVILSDIVGKGASGYVSTRGQEKRAECRKEPEQKRYALFLRSQKERENTDWVYDTRWEVDEWKVHYKTVEK